MMTRSRVRSEFVESIVDSGIVRRLKSKSARSTRQIEVEIGSFDSADCFPCAKVLQVTRFEERESIFQFFRILVTNSEAHAGIGIGHHRTRHFWGTAVQLPQFLVREHQS